MLYHPYGYGGITLEDAVFLPGSPTALVLDWRGDNAGPPMSAAEVIADWKAIAAEFPGADIVAGTLDEFIADALTPAVRSALPVVTTEMGDTWVHGVSSDPLKTAQWRVGSAAVAACLASGACDPADATLRHFVMLWGKNIFNKYYWTAVIPSSDSSARLAGKPTTYGVTLSFKMK